METLKTESNQPKEEKSEQSEDSVEEKLKKLKNQEKKLKEEQKQKEIEKEKVDCAQHRHCSRCFAPKPLDVQTICINCRTEKEYKPPWVI